MVASRQARAVCGYVANRFQLPCVCVCEIAFLVFLPQTDEMKGAGAHAEKHVSGVRIMKGNLNE